jgi:hypothetical protein
MIAHSGEGNSYKISKHEEYMISDAQKNASDIILNQLKVLDARFNQIRHSLDATIC